MSAYETHDVDFIRSVVCHPACFTMAVDDGDPHSWYPPSGEHIHWLRNDAGGAVAMVYRVNGSLWAYDAAVSPEARPPNVPYTERREAIEQVKEWLRANTDCSYLCAFIASDNLRSVRAAVADGLTLVGSMKNAKRRRGVLLDVLIYGIGV